MFQIRQSLYYSTMQITVLWNQKTTDHPCTIVTMMQFVQTSNCRTTVHASEDSKETVSIAPEFASMTAAMGIAGKFCKTVNCFNLGLVYIFFKVVLTYFNF